MDYLRLAIILTAISPSVLAVKLPKGWTTCKMDDPKNNECLMMAVQAIIPDLVKGVPSLQIPSVDPLRFNEVFVKQGNGPISLTLNLTNLDMKGIRNGVIESVDNKNWKTLTARVASPKLSTESQYSIDGRMLILPIRGHGDAKLTFDKFNALIKLEMKEETKKGKVYMKVDKFTMDLDCEKFGMDLDNLFDGNKALGDQMKVFFAENEREIWNELKGPFSVAISEGMKQISNRLFSKVPKSEIVPTK